MIDEREVIILVKVLVHCALSQVVGLSAWSEC